MRAALLEPRKVKALALIDTRSGLDAQEVIDSFHGLRNCKGFVRVPGAGHAPNLTHRQWVNPPLADFLARYA